MPFRKRRGGRLSRSNDNLTEDQLLDQLDDNNQSKYLDSDRQRYKDWEQTLKEKHERERQEYEDRDYLEHAIDPEKETRQQKITKLVQKDPKFRDIYLRQMKGRQEDFQNNADQEAENERDRIDEIRDQEDAEKKASDPWRFATDTLIDASSYIPVVGKTVHEITSQVRDHIDGGSLTIHHIKVKDSIPFNQALKHAQHILKTKRNFPKKIVGLSWHFKNLPKERFKQDSFRSKKINNDITIVFGQLK